MSIFLLHFLYSVYMNLGIFTIRDIVPRLIFRVHILENGQSQTHEKFSFSFLVFEVLMKVLKLSI